MTVLVLVEHDRGEMAEAARQALTAARNLAESLSVDLHACAVGEGADELVEAVGAYGPDVLHLVEHDLLTDYGPDAWAESLSQLADEVEPVAVVSVGTDRGNEVMANLAARTMAPFVANCLTVDDDPSDDDETWALTRVQWGGSLLEEATITAERKLLTFAHHAVPAEVDEGDPEVETFAPDLDDSILVTMVQDRTQISQGITLATAPVVVSGGRGVGSADAFAPLEELAGLLGGRVGCSRAVTNNGWRPHSDQVGQTGTRIAPDLYIATGISGAIQHWVGAMASKKILAINTDPEANMVVKADYAVIGDLHKVVPAITEEIQKRQS